MGRDKDEVHEEKEEKEKPGQSHREPPVVLLIMQREEGVKWKKILGDHEEDK